MANMQKRNSAINQSVNNFFFLSRFFLTFAANPNENADDVVVNTIKENVNTFSSKSKKGMSII
jgi:hypothetical protein